DGIRVFHVTGVRRVLFRSPPQVTARHVAFFQLSGGSTGTPKLIPRTHDDYLYSVRASAEICELNQQTKMLMVLPVAHNFSLSSRSEDRRVGKVLKCRW